MMVPDIDTAHLEHALQDQLWAGEVMVLEPETAMQTGYGQPSEDEASELAATVSTLVAQALGHSGVRYFRQRLAARRIADSTAHGAAHGSGRVWVSAPRPRAGAASTTGENDEPIYLPPVDPWMHEIYDNIAAHRSLHPGWDGVDAPPPDPESLDTAELLASAFIDVPVSGRPAFAVDAAGRPSFAAYTDSLYFHLTIDTPTTISWYAVKNGEERFEDEVEFDGIHIPKGLRRLFAP